MNRVSFLNHFLEYIGRSECPTEYLKWAARSLVAACMGNRVYTHMRIGATDEQVYPSLYVILVGPSVNYKSFAISRVMKLLRDVEVHRDYMNLYTGRTTAQGMYDAMRAYIWRNNPDGTRIRVDIPQRGQIYLVNDELANNIGLGERAETMIVNLTEMFLGNPFYDRTRANGVIHLENYSVNWLAATTPAWMRLALTRDSILGGFLGRVIIINQPITKERIFSTERAHNWNLLKDILLARLNTIFEMQGPFTKTPEAARLEEAWYMSRPELREDDPTESNYRRQQALSLKLAIVESVINGDEPWITADHMMEGQLQTEYCSKLLHEVIPSVVTTNHHADSLLRYVERKGIVTKTELSRQALSRYGWRADERDRWVRTWIDAGIVVEDRQAPNKGGTSYKFVGRKRSR